MPAVVEVYRVDDRRMDFLLVIDDSPSMAEAHRTLNEVIPVFVDALLGEEYEFRLAVVSSDAAQFVSTSCHERSEAFADEPELCGEVCWITELELEPPWMEVSSRADNLPVGLPPLDVLHCVAPLGLGGEDNADPLATMRTALLAQPDFRRDGIPLGIWLITEDDADGSAQPYVDFVGPDARVSVVAPEPAPPALAAFAGGL